MGRARCCSCGSPKVPGVSGGLHCAGKRSRTFDSNRYLSARRAHSFERRFAGILRSKKHQTMFSCWQAARLRGR